MQSGTPRLANRIIRFDAMDAMEEQMRPVVCEDAFCCLGTTRRAAGSARAPSGGRSRRARWAAAMRAAALSGRPGTHQHTWRAMQSLASTGQLPARL